MQSYIHYITYSYIYPTYIGYNPIQPGAKKHFIHIYNDINQSDIRQHLQMDQVASKVVVDKANERPQ